jgi:Zn-dependent protease with chaperone function
MMGNLAEGVLPRTLAHDFSGLSWPALSQDARACRFTHALVFFFFCICAAANAQGQDNAAAQFQFTKVDTQVLDDANEFEHQLDKKGLVLQNPDLQAYLDSIANRVIGARPAPEQVQFRFRVLRDPMVNAFAMPNGTVYVTTGLLSVLENEAQLASVLGHESTHVFNRHTYLQNRSVRKKALAINVIVIAASEAPMGKNGGQNWGPRVQLFGSAVQLGAAISETILVASMYGYSREREREADLGGLTAMTSASYDPHAMARTFELLDESGKLEYEPILGFYHDHPKLTERHATALEFASAHTLQQPLLGSETEYLAKVSPAICYNIEADLNSGRARSAVVGAKRLVTAFPDEPKYQVLLADSYRTLGAKTAVASEEERSRHGQAELRKEYFRMTEEEEQRHLLEKPEGKATLQENLDRAEALYLGVIQRNPNVSEAYRGLGFLYEQQAKYAEAARQYRRYLELVAGTTLDRLRIERRLAAVEKLASPQPPVSR